MKIKIFIGIEKNSSDIIPYIQVFHLKSNKGNYFRTDKYLLRAQVSGSPAQNILSRQLIFSQKVGFQTDAEQTDTTVPSLP